MDCITEPNERLVEFGVGGICNSCVGEQSNVLNSTEFFIIVKHARYLFNVSIKHIFSTRSSYFEFIMQIQQMLLLLLNVVESRWLYNAYLAQLRIP